MKTFLRFMCISFLFIALAQSADGHETLENVGSGGEKIGVVEKTGQTIPADLVFFDENGDKVKIGSFRGKPMLLTLVYYTCEHICPLMLGGLSQALPRLAFQAGKDYEVVTVSFDDTDTPKTARDIKKNYIKAAGTGFSEQGWTFLTGKREDIHRLTDAVGFTYRRDDHGFSHPVVLIFVAPDGKITKYFYVTKFEYGQSYPINFSSFDLNMALTEAAEGKVVTGLKKALLYCFSHEPPGQSKFYNFIAVIGLVTLAAMVSFFIYLQVTTRRLRRGKEYDIEK
ncbi:MAG TPA: SCO family protein [Syntrophales bacterium]|nr:SCO family protein [Syntrophales bacterium]